MGVLSSGQGTTLVTLSALGIERPEFYTKCGQDARGGHRDNCHLTGTRRQLQQRKLRHIPRCSPRLHYQGESPTGAQVRRSSRLTSLARAKSRKIPDSDARK